MNGEIRAGRMCLTRKDQVREMRTQLYTQKLNRMKMFKIMRVCYE